MEQKFSLPVVPDHARQPVSLGAPAPLLTSARTDQELVDSWVDGMGSEHTRVNFEPTARAFLAALAPVTLRATTVEQVRGAIDAISSHMRASSRAQVLARVKSLLGYAKRVGFTQFDPGPVLRLRRREGETTQVAADSWTKASCGGRVDAGCQPGCGWLFGGSRRIASSPRSCRGGLCQSD